MIKFEVQNPELIFMIDELSAGHAYVCTDKQDGEKMICIVNQAHQVIVVQSERGGFLVGENISELIADRGWDESRFTFKAADLHISAKMK